MKDGVNWYVYCANNPLKFVDPNGLEWVIINGKKVAINENTDIFYLFLVFLSGGIEFGDTRNENGARGPGGSLKGYDPDDGVGIEGEASVASYNNGVI